MIPRLQLLYIVFPSSKILYEAGVWKLNNIQGNKLLVQFNINLSELIFHEVEPAAFKVSNRISNCKAILTRFHEIIANIHSLFRAKINTQDGQNILIVFFYLNLTFQKAIGSFRAP